eukprot:TRINITY_DN8707_c0_g1_i1.p1 TRINITY_DN8707_c0_g1~~TRINITY_DN8707_c0_g1_i1.p1  ORF type:complete len:813 (-),score=144.43 TRINITY_DN8707_c0_g1_i1:82-2520(-)
MSSSEREPLLGHRDNARVKPIASRGEPYKTVTSPPLSVLLNPIFVVLWVFDFIVWFGMLIGPFRWVSSRICGRRATVCIKEPNVNVSDEAAVEAGASGEALIWRAAGSEEGLLNKPFAGAVTVPKALEEAFTRFHALNAMGTRKYLGDHHVDGSRFPLKKFGETKWDSYTVVQQKVRCFGRGLLEIGLQPLPVGIDLQNTAGPHSILIFEETCAAWTIACLGAFTQSIVVATSYATLGLSAVEDAIEEVGAAAVVCNLKSVPQMAALRSSKCKNIIFTRNLCLDNESPPSDLNTMGRRVAPLDEIISLGEQRGDLTDSPPAPERLGVIMYTSGSTGKPKGVMITHANLIASVGSVHRKLANFGLEQGEETYLAYLPAAHIMELVLQITALVVGTSVGFACPKTISSKGACRQRPDGSINTLPEYPYPPGSIQEFRPTVMAAVPKIWDILKKSVEEGVGKGSWVLQSIFQAGFTGRNWAVHQGRGSPIINALVFRKLANLLGGRMKVAISGGGPLSAEVHNFIRIAFGMPLLQGYALTETCCAGSVQEEDDTRDGVVGPPLASVEMKLRSCLAVDGSPEVLDREMKPYLSSDRSHYGEPCGGRGEVLLRGPSVSLGYFKQPAKTAEVFDSDGWFHSGDVGIWQEDGSLVIVDRVKNLVKMKGGEYIALESMEKEYSTSIYVNTVNGGVMCYGDGDMDRPVALVQANIPELEKWATSSGVAFDRAEDLCKSEDAEKLVLNSLTEAGKAANLGRNELLCAVALIPGTGNSTNPLEATSPWTSENGGLTASNKLSRQAVQTACARILGPLRQKGSV